VADLPENFFQWAGLIVGAVSAYFGALNAVKERLATLDARMDAVKEDAAEAKAFAQSAHDRINRMNEK